MDIYDIQERQKRPMMTGGNREVYKRLSKFIYKLESTYAVSVGLYKGII